jgi:hypothetical protein
MLLGGTLFQLLVPTAFVVALLRQGDRHGATVPLWWLGQNCWNVSLYIKDARTPELPLVGGGEHDWALMLGELAWLDRDQAIGGTVFLIGVALYMVAIVLGWRTLASGGGSDEPATRSANPADPGESWR